MTNAEIKLEDAVKNRDDGKLNDREVKFVEQLEGWNKKQLRKLSKNQYLKLREIAEK